MKRYLTPSRKNCRKRVNVLNNRSSKYTRSSTQQKIASVARGRKHTLGRLVVIHRPRFHPTVQKSTFSRMHQDRATLRQVWGKIDGRDWPVQSGLRTTIVYPDSTCAFHPWPEATPADDTAISPQLPPLALLSPFLLLSLRNSLCHRVPSQWLEATTEIRAIPRGFSSLSIPSIPVSKIIPIQLRSKRFYKIMRRIKDSS